MIRPLIKFSDIKRRIYYLFIETYYMLSERDGSDIERR